MQITEVHKKEFGCAPQAVASAPDCFHLIGEHSWFFKDKTLSLAIDSPVLVSVSARTDDFFYYYWLERDERKKTNVLPIKFKKDDKWANLFKAVVHGLSLIDVELPGLDFTLSAEALSNFVLGRANAVKVAAAYAINEALSLGLSADDLISAISLGTRELLREECLLADMYAAIYGKKNSFVITDYASEKVDVLPFDFSGKSIIMIETKVPRFVSWRESSLHEPEYALLMGDLKEQKQNAFGGWVYNENVADIHEILAACGEKNIRKLIALIREHRSVLEARDGILSGQFGVFARAVNFSHESMRDYYEISSPEVDWILKRILSISPNLSDVRNPYSCGRISETRDFCCVYSILPDGDIPEMKKKFAEFERIFGFKIRYFKICSSDGVKIVS